MDGHVVDHAKDIATANEYAATTEYDLILLDIMLPDGDGRDFLASRGSKNLKTPIIDIYVWGFLSFAQTITYSAQ